MRTWLELRRVLFRCWSTGCWANGAPLCALLEGAVVSASFAAAPVVPVAVKVTGLPVSPAAVAVSVFVPAVVPSVHDVTAAMPLPFVATLVGLTEIGRASCRDRA